MARSSQNAFIRLQSARAHDKANEAALLARKPRQTETARGTRRWVIWVYEGAERNAVAVGQFVGVADAIL